MQRSTDRILTTHVGSFIRPDELLTYIRPLQAGAPYDIAAQAGCLKSSVAEIVRQQAVAGPDVVSDGEFGKSISWSQYALERLSGFEKRPISADGNTFAQGANPRHEHEWKVWQEAGLTLSNGVMEKGMRSEEFIDKQAASRPLKRRSMPEDIVGTVLFFASYGSDFITGQTVAIDGGAAAH